MNWITILAAVPILMDMILKLVKQFEVPGIAGVDKKAAVIAVIKAALDILPKAGIQVPTEMILSIVSVLIDAIILVYNNFGIFSHEPKGVTS